MKSVCPDPQKVYLQYNTIQTNTKNIYERGPFEALFHTYSLLMCKVSTLSFHVGVAGERLLVHYILPLPGAVYHDLLLSVLPELLKVMDLESRICL
jgi:hypothetical protein